jgi:hypothetical protein
MKELVEQDEDFKELYLATKESILKISLSIIAVSALLITFIMFLG